MNCYECIFVGNLPGNVHKRCSHPDLEDGNKFVAFICFMTGKDPFGFNLKFEEHEFDRGWFNWPLNFDPIWIKSCDKIEVKKNGDY